jgi:hypothetical protein
VVILSARRALALWGMLARLGPEVIDGNNT